MSRLLQLIWTGLYLQVTTGYPSCSLMGQKARCSFQRHRWVPVLPPTITHLFLDGNHISEINSTSLRDFPELQYLDLAEQKAVLVIRNDSFLRQRNLVQLELGFNRGLTLEPRAFDGLSRLQVLFLYYCSLTDSILSGAYLEPLVSLEELDLYGNNIGKLQPALFFQNLTKLTKLNLKLNHIERICEEDVVGFEGKNFTMMSLNSNSLSNFDAEWGSCGNPFKGMAFRFLDLSTNGLNAQKTKQFFNAIQGTPIHHLKYGGIIGKGFSHNNTPDPDRSTFQGLGNSLVVTLDLSDNWIFALESGVFSAFKDLTFIDVSKNKINQIKINAFSGLQRHLKELDLSSNLLGEIFAHTFSSLTELLLLDLSYNHIGKLGHNAFEGLPNLRHLYLTGNSLRQLGSVASLPSLNTLWLQDNRLNSISADISLVMNSTVVDLSDNRLTNMEDVYVILTQLKHLQFLFFGGNLFKWCTINQGQGMPDNNSLKFLDLHGSSLQPIWEQRTCLDIFDRLSNLLYLNLSLNSLMALPQGIFRGLSSISELDLSSNALTYLQTDVFPPSLETLHLSNNFLVSPDPNCFRSLRYLSLSANRFYCDCTLWDFLEWLNSSNVILGSPVQEYKCEFPAAVHNLPLVEYAMIIEPCEEDDEKDVQDLRFALFTFSAILILSVTLSGVIYARLRGHIFITYKKLVSRFLEGPKMSPNENNQKYDAFVCFSIGDYRWVEAALLEKLDNQFSEENLFRCCFEARDFLPGEDHLSNIRDAIWSSRKTLCVVSKRFLTDGWCLEAFSLAQGRMLEELKHLLIMVVVGKVAHYQLMKCDAIRSFVQKRRYFTWPEDPQDLAWFHEQLISQILKDARLKEEAVVLEPDHRPEPDKGIALEIVNAT
nr:toll-like receptor 5 [Nothobranchius furzeri]XP_054604491.1 toll-like receptor 5 [Nothobranchius furzeri]